MGSLGSWCELGGCSSEDPSGHRQEDAGACVGDTFHRRPPRSEHSSPRWVFSGASSKGTFPTLHISTSKSPFLSGSSVTRRTTDDDAQPPVPTAPPPGNRIRNKRSGFLSLRVQCPRSWDKDVYVERSIFQPHSGHDQGQAPGGRGAGDALKARPCLFRIYFCEGQVRSMQMSFYTSPAFHQFHHRN